MWPIPSLNHEQVIIIFESSAIFCVCIKKHSTFLMLKAAEKRVFNNLEMIDGRLFNIAAIDTFIREFLTTHHLLKTPISFVISEKLAHESFATTLNAHPTLTELFTYSPDKYVCQHLYVYPSDHGSVFYTCALRRDILFQYQLVGIRNHLNLHRITTSIPALISLYKYVYGKTFRTAQLAQHMKQNDHDLKLLFSSDLLARILHISCSQRTLFSTQDQHTLLVACGLFVAKGAEE